MTYQKITDDVRSRENFFAGWEGGWPGHYGPARSKYPNLAAELVAREWQIGTPVEAARVSREVLAGVIEDGDILDAKELRSISDRLGISNQYLCSPVLSMVNPMTNKGRCRIAILKRLLEAAERYGVYCGLFHNTAHVTLAQMERGTPVTYASWRWACQRINDALEWQQSAEERRRTIRTERRVAS